MAIVMENISGNTLSQNPREYKFASCTEQGEHAEVFFLPLQTKLQYTQLVVYISGEFCM